jgi:hypothetical protein
MSSGSAGLYHLDAVRASVANLYFPSHLATVTRYIVYFRTILLASEQR